MLRNSLLYLSRQPQLFRFAKNKLDANVSVKLTAMGQDISDDLCESIMRAILEPATVAFPDKADVDRNYVTCMQALMERGRYPGLATHDPGKRSA
jgi:hypothetical protein